MYSTVDWIESADGDGQIFALALFALISGCSGYYFAAWIAGIVTGTRIFFPVRFAAPFQCPFQRFYLIPFL